MATTSSLINGVETISNSPSERLSNEVYENNVGVLNKNTHEKEKNREERSKRKTVKLTMKQGLLMNQVVAAFALSDVKDSLCKKHVEEFKQGIRAFEPWALLMFDSSSKIPPGILSGNIVDYGSFEECLKVYKNTENGPIRGKFCSLKIKPSINLVKIIVGFKNISARRFEKLKDGILDGIDLVWSVCVPDSCAAKDVLSHFNKSVLELTEGLDIQVSLKDENCFSMETIPKLVLKHYIFLTFMALILILISISSICHWKFGSENKWIKNFSVLQNWRNLLSKVKTNSELDCLHGIRSLSICYVMFGHRYMTAMLFPSVNSFYLLEWVLLYSSTIIIGGTFCVDSFFLVSGTLVSYLFFEHVTKTRTFNLIYFYLHRYLRVTPNVCIGVILYSSFIQFFGSGPIWYDTYSSMQKPCQQFWWSTILHVQSYVNPRNLCIPQTWYLTCDMIYYYFSPIIIYPMWKWPLIGYIILILTYLSSIIISFYLAWINEYAGGQPLTRHLFKNKYFQYYYITPHTRASPYIIGLALGYALHKTRNKKIKMGLTLNIICWILAIICMSSVVLGSHVYQIEEHSYNRIESSMYLCWSRSVWTLGMVWIIWSCVHGYGGVVNYMLSLHVLKIFGRLSYSVYILHMAFQFLKEGATKNPSYYSDFYEMYDCCADLAVMVIIGTIYSLCFEYPCLGLESLILGNLQKDKASKVKSIENGGN